GVFFATVAARNNDDRAQSDAARRERHTLAVISTSRRNHAGYVGFAPAERVHVDQAAAHLERSHGRVILVLHPGLRSDAGAEQWPPDLRGCWHDAMDKFRRGLERSEGRQRHRSMPLTTLNNALTDTTMGYRSDRCMTVLTWPASPRTLLSRRRPPGA